MARIGLALLAAGALAAALAVVLGLWVSSPKPSRADALLVVGFDMNPAGNSCPGTGNAGGADCVLGSVEACVEVTSGGSFDFDVFMDGLPAGETLAGLDFYVGSGWWPPGSLTVTGRTLQTVGIDLLVDDPGSSDLFDGSDPLPNAVSPDHTTIVDLGIAEANPPFGRGVLARYTATVAPGTPAGTYGLLFDLAAGPVIIGNKPGVNLCDTYGCELWDANRTPQYGLVAVNTSCGGAATPVPSPTSTPMASPTPSPTSSPAPTATPTATATPTPGGLVTGWNHVCYLGPDQTISDALAGIGGGVLAVYRLTPGSGYDRWFPGRPDVSSMTDVSSYQSLFILMASNAAWQQEPADTAPASIDLAQAWNSVCYAGQTKGVEAATASIAGQFGVLYVLADQGWTRFIPGRPGLSNLSELRQFEAVVILVTNAGAQWSFDP